MGPKRAARRESELLAREEVELLPPSPCPGALAPQEQRWGTRKLLRLQGAPPPLLSPLGNILCGSSAVTQAAPPATLPSGPRAGRRDRRPGAFRKVHAPSAAGRRSAVPPAGRGLSKVRGEEDCRDLVAPSHPPFHPSAHRPVAQRILFAPPIGRDGNSTPRSTEKETEAQAEGGKAAVERKWFRARGW